MLNMFPDAWQMAIRTTVGKAKHLRIMPGGGLEQDYMEQYYIGQKLEEHRGAFLLSNPMERGRVRGDVDDNDKSSWEQMELLWKHLYSKDMLNAKTEEHPVLLTETPLNPMSNRERIAEIFFETFNVPALFFAPQSVLSLYASGRTTGVVLDVGEGVTHAVPVYEGFALPHSITRSDLGGFDVTQQMQLQLRRSGLNLTTTSEMDLVKDIKEQVCFVSANQTKDEDSGEIIQYQLPDGQVVDLGKERFRAPEVLFQPNLMGSEEMDVAKVLVQSIQKSDIDLRATLFDQTVLAGGTTMMRGFGTRLLQEVRQSAPQHTRLRISAPSERVNSAWVGGSILASLATFKHMWVSKQEYETEGVKSLHQSAV
jgi:centractin